MILEHFKVIGISVRTINKNNTAQTDIKSLWNTWFSENISDKISNKVSDNLYNIYTDYESDEHGYYTCFLGHAVGSIDSMPKGLVGKYIPKSNYKELISNGKLPECVLKTWEAIWSLKFDRSYIADFDVYDPNTMNSENAEVKTYLSIN
jgi:predicted transcriptional regulator YdeE